MARVNLYDTVLDTRGNALDGTLTVTLDSTGAAATLYAAETGGTTVANPYTFTNGTVNVWVDGGRYDLSYLAGGVTVTKTVDLIDSGALGDGGLAAHAADTTAIHGIADTSLLTTAASVAASISAATATLVPATLLDAKGDLITASADNTPARLPVGTDAHVLTLDSGQALGIKWAAAPGAAGGIAATIFDAKGDLIVASANDTAARLAAGANGLVLTTDSAEATGLKWAAVPADEVTQAELDAHIADTTAIHGIANTADVVLRTLADQKGDLFVASAADVLVRRAVGTNGQVLTADSAESDGVKWATPAASGGTINDPVAGLHDLLAWTLDPNADAASLSTTEAVAGNVYAIRVPVPKQITMANLLVYVASAGVTLTVAQNFGGVYSSSGTLIAKTADQETPWESSGLKTMALTAEGGQSLTQGGEGVELYLAVLTNGATAPNFASRTVSSTYGNMNLATPNLRVARKTTGGQTSLPAALGAQTSETRMFWMALS